MKPFGATSDLQHPVDRLDPHFNPSVVLSRCVHGHVKVLAGGQEKSSRW
jgi:hypothetical protein